MLGAHSLVRSNEIGPTGLPLFDATDPRSPGGRTLGGSGRWAVGGGPYSGQVYMHMGMPSPGRWLAF